MIIFYVCDSIIKIHGGRVYVMDTVVYRLVLISTSDMADMKSCQVSVISEIVMLDMESSQISTGGTELTLN